ncbi:hypothetical protein ECZU51_46540 [Escherichia coli]|nr:hypothetical protein ECZU51_46540 [Escherichia coli]
MVLQQGLTDGAWQPSDVAAADGSQHSGGAALHDIPEGYVRVAEQHGVPAEVLYAVSLTETAMVPSAIGAVMKKRNEDYRVPAVARPSPWTINVAGRGYRYASRLEARQALRFSETISGPTD